MVSWWLEQKAVTHIPIISTKQRVSRCVFVYFLQKAAPLNPPNTPLAWNQVQTYNLFKPPERFISMSRKMSEKPCVSICGTQD